MRLSCWSPDVLRLAAALAVAGLVGLVCAQAGQSPAKAAAKAPKVAQAATPAQAATSAAKPPAKPPTPVLLAAGDAYRVGTFRESGALTVALRNAAGDWLNLGRKGGELGWYGYDSPKGEASTTAVVPKVTRRTVAGVADAHVACTIAPGVVSVADYVARPRYCAVVTEIQAKTEPKDANIVRVAPRFDIDLRRLPCYALRDAKGVLNTGEVTAVASRPGYIGVGAWGEGSGCRVSSLDPTRPYLAFFNPNGGPLVAFIFFHPVLLWRDTHHFLQLWTGNANYLYTGYVDSHRFNTIRAYGIYVRADGDLSAFERDLPAVMADFDKLVASGAVAVPKLRAARRVRDRLAALRGRFADAKPAKADWLGSWRAWYAYTRAREALDSGDVTGAQTVLSLLAPGGAAATRGRG